MAKTSDITNGIFMEYNGDLCLVTDFQRVSPGKGSSFVRTRLKNIASGKVVENNFKEGDDIIIVQVERKNMQFLYKAGEEYAFMDNSTFEQYTVSDALLDGKGKFLKEGMEATFMLYNGAPVGAQMPKKVKLKVVSAPEAVRGDTASGNLTKEVELETGATVRAPMFIKAGEEIMVNIDTEEYSERA